MDDKKLDEKLKESIKLGTEESLKLKDEIWSNIENNLDNKEKGRETLTIKNNKNKKKKRFIIQIGATAAAILLIVGATGTDTGQATLRKVKEFLVPEKTITEEIEGQKEDTDVVLNESKLGYTIYFDQDRYTLEKGEKSDVLTPIAKLDPELNLPPIYMEIKHVSDKDINTAAIEYEELLKEEFGTLDNNEEINNPIDSIFLKAKSGGNREDTIVKYFLIDDEHGGTFVVKQQYFLEAAEGHGVRFDNILKEFRIEVEE